MGKTENKNKPTTKGLPTKLKFAVEHTAKV